MKTKDITPEDSICPVFLEPWTDDEIAANEAAENKRIKVETVKAAARQAVLDRLGITADEAALLLG